MWLFLDVNGDLVTRLADSGLSSDSDSAPSLRNIEADSLLCSAMYHCTVHSILFYDLESDDQVRECGV